MTDKEIQELEAWLAEHAMGWKRTGLHEMGSERGEFFAHPNSSIIIPLQGNHVVTWSPARSQADTGDVLKACTVRLASEGKEETVSVGFDEPYWVVEKTNTPDSLRTEAPTMQQAICLFAQKLFCA